MLRLFLSAVLLLSLSATAQAWQVDSVHFQLQEELVIQGSDEWFFGGIADIEVDAEGNIYVNDDRQIHVKVFSPEGELTGTLGREGKGPGEFRDVTDIVVRGDELAVLDRKAFLVSFFNTSTMDYSNGFTFKPVQTEAGGGNAREIMYLPDNRIALVNSVSPSTSNADMERFEFVGVYTSEGDVLFERILEKPEEEMLVYKPSPSSVRVSGKPYARRSLYRSGPSGDIYYCWTDQLEIFRYDFSGGLQDTYRQEIRRAPASGDQKPWQFMPEHAPPNLKEIYKNPHETWPAVEQFLVDENGNIWARVRAGTEENINWLVLNAEGRITRVVDDPAGEVVRAIRNDRFYTSDYTDDGRYIARRYRLVPVQE